MKKIYLAIPYTWNPEESFKIANKVAARLMDKYIVFSPISHSHPVADYLSEELRFSQSFWMKQDLAFLSMCDEVWLIDLGKELTENSKGVQRELQEARILCKPIRKIKHE